MATFTAGQVLTAAQLNALFDAAQSAWTAYTPTWTAATTNPAVGNGTITGRYKLIGKTAWATVNITFGSTTTAGSGVYTFGLPAGAPASNAVFHVGSAWVSCAGTAYVASVRADGSGALRVNTGNADLASATPGVWASGNSIRFTYAYETT